MEEKLRNLSQNIANNTGPREAENHEAPEEPQDTDINEENRPAEENHEEHHDEGEHNEEHHEDSPVEELQENLDEQNEDEEREESESEVSDYTPEPEENDKQIEERHESEESHEEGNHEEKHEEEKLEEQDVPVEKADDSKAEPIEINHEEPMILSMDEETEQPVSNTPKYSPEVEAALSRLNAEEESGDYTEPLSTEPAKKRHHGFRNFLIILFILAVAAVLVCVLVEQNIIDNPFPNLFKKSPETSEQTPTEKKAEPSAEIPLTDEKLLAEVDKLFVELHKDIPTFYVVSKTYQKIGEDEYIYYNSAEPSTDVTNCINSITDGEDTTNCKTAVSSDVTITAENFQNYSQYRYVFKKTEFGLYEFQEKHPVVESKETNDLVDNTNTEKK